MARSGPTEEKGRLVSEAATVCSGEKSEAVVHAHREGPAVALIVDGPALIAVFE
ncbi:MAG: hypothetical protein ACI8Y6_001410, partial [Brevundimonas sp.]